MTKQELAQKIKAKYPQYQSIEDNELADKIIAKYPVYQSQITEAKPSLSGLKENLLQRGEQFKDIAKKTGSGEINPLQTGVRTVGTTIGAAGDVLFQVIKEGVKAVSPKTVEAIKGGVSKVGESDLVKNISEKYSDWANRNPEQAKDLEATLNIASIIPVGKAGQVVSKSVGQVAQKTGTALKSAATKVKPAIGGALSTTGAIGEKVGKSLVSASLSPTMEQAGRIITYKSKTPLLTRLKQASMGAEKAPITPAGVAIKYDLASLSRSQIAVKAKRVSNDLFNNQVKPSLSAIKEKATKSELFKSIEKKIANTKDISNRKSLQNAFDALKDDYKNVNSWSYSTLNDIKSEMARRLPSKVWKGQDVAGDLNNIRKMFSDKARSMIREKLPVNVRTIFDEYGSLKELSERGAKALTSGLNTNLIGLTGEAMRMATTPFTTIGGSAISKAGTAVRKLGNRLLKSKPLPKGKGEILKSTPLKTGDYLYHGTNEDVLDNIIKDGLKPGMRGQLSLSKTEDYAKSFARDGITPTGKTSGIMLRIKTGALNGKTTLKRADGKTRPMSDQLNEILTKETVSPESLEILKNGKWIPLTDYKKLPLKSTPLKKSVNTLEQEAQKYKSAEEFVKKEMFNPSSKYEWHLSDNPNLIEGKLMSEQIKPKNIGGRGFAGREENIGDVFSTKSPQWWYQQLNYETGGKAPKYAYLVEIKNPQKADIMDGLAQQSISNPNDIRIIKKAGGKNEIENPSLLDNVKIKYLQDIWYKLNK